MAGSINGIGSTYYGQGDFHDDGSYVTTKWFIIGFIPLIPLESIRVKEVGGYGMFAKSEKLIVGEVPIDFAQVCKTWLYAAVMVALAVLMMESKLPPLVQFGALAAGAFLPYTLRWFAKKNASEARPAPRTRPNPFAGTPLPTAPITTCPKCSYTRTPADQAPAWQCPSCQVAYNKVTPQALAAQAEARPRR